MTLPEAIAAVEELTGRLERSLAADDLTACGALLQERGEALRQLAVRLRAAGPREIGAVTGDLERIAARDVTLQAQVTAALERLRQELARLEGAPRQRARGEPGDLDRRA